MSWELLVFVIVPGPIKPSPHNTVPICKPLETVVDKFKKQKGKKEERNYP